MRSKHDRSVREIDSGAWVRTVDPTSITVSPLGRRGAPTGGTYAAGVRFTSTSDIDATSVQAAIEALAATRLAAAGGALTGPLVATYLDMVVIVFGPDQIEIGVDGSAQLRWTYAAGLQLDDLAVTPALSWEHVWHTAAPSDGDMADETFYVRRQCSLIGLYGSCVTAPATDALLQIIGGPAPDDPDDILVEATWPAGAYALVLDEIDVPALVAEAGDIVEDGGESLVDSVIDLAAGTYVGAKIKAAGGIAGVTLQGVFCLR